MKELIEIKRYDNRQIIFSCEAEDVREAVKEAIKQGISFEYAYLIRVDLSCLDLSGVNFSFAMLNGSNLTYTKLVGTNFSNAILNGVKLLYCDLRKANLGNTEIKCSDLSFSNLRGINLSNIDFSYTIFFHSNLNSCNLSGSNLYGSSLVEAKIKNIINDENTKYFKQQCPESGSFIGWKKCYGMDKSTYIVKLKITNNAKRSSATTNKCRCSEATCIEIQRLGGVVSKIKNVYSYYNMFFTYEVGKTYKIKDFNDDRWRECSAGIHFFMNREDAVKYNI